MATTAYLIDPFEGEVRLVQLGSDTGTFDELHELYALLECGIVEAVVPENSGSDVMYVDEEGKLRKPALMCGFVCSLWPHDVIVGKALWIGSTSDGNNCAPEMTIDYVREHVVWMRRDPPTGE
ncbi:DUF3846 domain-containing protein [Paraburkholderia humisilvae]|uniref:DUF3846 domain-containing protein n=1 Tax=Paraburkholderia humisilvae TaxID=627669 RepID=A0A6J5DXB2_9BURK|nr:hypothetical protein [Paraburkholderia humisilvae]CAB3758708.1 hypothetical protein LMG29542_03410 [Paraburkholderia humisilvae]